MLADRSDRGQIFRFINEGKTKVEPSELVRLRFSFVKYIISKILTTLISVRKFKIQGGVLYNSD
jgi:hypothetical protein